MSPVPRIEGTRATRSCVSVLTGVFDESRSLSSPLRRYDEASGMCDSTKVDPARRLVGDARLTAVCAADRAGVLFDCVLTEVAELWWVTH
jgi:hypothetical protein